MHTSDATARAWACRVFGVPDDAPVARGAFHQVVLGPDVVVRVLQGGDQEARAAREHANHAALPERLGPAALSAVQGLPVTDGGLTGHVLTAVPGEERDVTWDEAREPLTGLLELLRTTPAPAGVAPVRAWCGGPRLVEIVASHFGDQLADSHADAVRVVETVDALTWPDSVFVNGDSGPHNVLWEGDRVAALIDFDHATVGDPALDVAPLVGFFGARAVAGITDRDTLERALWYRAALPLQVAAAAHEAGLAKLRKHALGNFRRRWLAGTAFDPEGSVPRE